MARTNRENWSTDIYKLAAVALAAIRHEGVLA
jgi:hypothetical protein